MFQYTVRMLVYPTQKVLSSATLSNEIYCCSFLVKNLVVCVPSTAADCNSFCNHRNRKVVEAYTMFYYSIWMLVHPTQLALSSATLSNERFCSSFLIKYHVVCVPSTTAK